MKVRQIMAEEYIKGSGSGRGGWRGGGRPVGSKSSKPKTDKIYTLNNKLTFAEKEYLTKCLEDFRNKNKD